MKSLRQELCYYLHTEHNGDGLKVILSLTLHSTRTGIAKK